MAMEFLLMACYSKKNAQCPTGVFTVGHTKFDPDQRFSIIAEGLAAESVLEDPQANTYT